MSADLARHEVAVAVGGSEWVEIELTSHDGKRLKARLRPGQAMTVAALVQARALRLMAAKEAGDV